MPRKLYYHQFEFPLKNISFYAEIKSVWMAKLINCPGPDLPADKKEVQNINIGIRYMKWGLVRDCEMLYKPKFPDYYSKPL